MLLKCFVAWINLGVVLESLELLAMLNWGSDQHGSAFATLRSMAELVAWDSAPMDRSGFPSPGQIRSIKSIAFNVQILSDIYQHDILQMLNFHESESKASKIYVLNLPDLFNSLRTFHIKKKGCWPFIDPDIFRLTMINVESIGTDQYAELVPSESAHWIHSSFTFHLLDLSI